MHKVGGFLEHELRKCENKGIFMYTAAWWWWCRIVVPVDWRLTMSSGQHDSTTLDRAAWWT